MNSSQPSLFNKTSATFPLDRLQSPTTLRRTTLNKTEIRDLRRSQTAAEALSGFGQGVEIYGFTKGQFSLVNIIEAALEITGPANLTVSTWAAAKTSISTILGLVKSGKLTDSKWLIDLTLQRRLPELTKSIRDTFGSDSIRVGANHAKWFMLQNADWNIVCITSMNLNHNPRFENFMIRTDRAMCEFHSTIIGEIWKNQKPSLASQSPAQINQHFRETM